METFPWKRSWYYVGKENIPITNFTPPNIFPSEFFPSRAFPWDEISQIPCLILLGEPGMGKSTVMNTAASELRQQGSSVFYRDLSRYTTDHRLIEDLFRNAELQSWIDNSGNEAGTVFIFLDSLDEARLQVIPVVDILSDGFQSFKNHPRIYLRIACRANEWPIHLEEHLESVWGENSIGKFLLAPLQDRDIAIAAEANGVDKEMFLTAVRDARAIPFAERPVTLGFLVNIFKKDNQIVNSQVELYKQGLTLLCEEPSPSRRYAERGRYSSRYSSKERFRMAAYIAAMMFFSNRAAIWREPNRGDVPSDHLLVSDMLAAKSILNLDEQLFHNTLEYSLFSGSGTASVNWAHQSYGEFLAAWCISRMHNTTKDQLLSVLTDSSGLVIPQLRTIAAWIASMREEVLDFFIINDPEVALTVDSASFKEDSRRAIVDNLLALIKKIKRQSEQREIHRLYSNLNYPGLAEQLHHYIVDEAQDLNVRRTAIEIAGECALTELSGELVTIALNEPAKPLRIAALSALEKIGNDGANLRLKDLAIGQRESDPNDELKGYALRILWPRLISTEELFEMLTPPRRKNFLGMYRLFLWGDFVNDIPLHDLPLALDWIPKQPLGVIEADDPFQDLITRLMLKGWDNLDDPKVFSSFAKVAYSRLSHLRPLISRDAIFDRSDRYFSPDAFREAILTDHLRRRKLLLEVLRINDDPDSPVWYFASNNATPICTLDDFEFLLDVGADTNDEGLRDAIIRLAIQVFRWDREDHIRKLFDTVDHNPHYAAHYTGLLFSRIDTPNRQLILEHNRRRREQEKETEKEIEIRLSEFNQLFERIENGEYELWWRLYLELTRDEPGSRFCFASRVDLSRGAVWTSLSEERKAKTVGYAKFYLQNYVSETDIEVMLSEFINQRTIYYTAYAAIGALFISIHLEPDFLKSLDIDTWNRWSPFVIAYDFTQHDESTLETLVLYCWENARGVVLSTLRQLIESENRKSGNIFCLRRVNNCWDDQIEELLLKLLKDQSLTPESFLSILTFLFRHDSEKVLDFCRLIVTDDSADFQDRVRSVIASYSLLAFGDGIDWATIWNRIQDDKEYADQLISRLASWSDIQPFELSKKLKEAELTDFYLWLYQRYPPSEDPHALEDADGFHQVTIREQIGRWRDSIIYELRDKGSEAAVEQIERIAASLPEAPWLNQFLADSIYRMRRETWKPLNPDHVLGLLENKDARLVQTGQELQQVIVESIEGLQKELSGETPASELLWNTWNSNGQTHYRPKEENVISDYLKRHLERDLTQRGVVLNREVQIRRRQGNISGQQTDIQVDAVIEDSGRRDVISTIIEVKGNWNRELKDAMSTQLKERYLRQANIVYGIYIVGWFDFEHWDDSDNRKNDARRLFKTLEEAQTYFYDQALELSTQGFVLRSIVVNASL